PPLPRVVAVSTPRLLGPAPDVLLLSAPLPGESSASVLFAFDLFDNPFSGLIGVFYGAELRDSAPQIARHLPNFSNAFLRVIAAPDGLLILGFSVLRYRPSPPAFLDEARGRCPDFAARDRPAGLPADFQRSLVLLQLPKPPLELPKAV